MKKIAPSTETSIGPSHDHVEWTSTEALLACIPEPVHPAANRSLPWPLDKLLATADEAKRLGRIIRPIQRLAETGEIIDGRHRRMICLIANIEPEFEDITLPAGVTPDDYVFLCNDARQHMTLDQAAAVAAERYVNLREEGKLFRTRNLKQASASEVEKIPIRVPGNSLAFLSKLYQVNTRYIQQATAVLELDPELFDRLKKGKIKLKDARLAVGLVQRERDRLETKASGLDEACRTKLKELVAAVLRLESLKSAKLKVALREVVALAAHTTEQLRLG